MLYWHTRVSETDGATLVFQDLLHVNMKGGDLRAFLNDRGLTLVGMSQASEEHILETLFRTQVQKDSGLKEHLSCYERLPGGHPEKIQRVIAS